MSNYVSTIVMAVVAVIIVVSVGYPVVTTTISNYNFSVTNATGLGTVRPTGVQKTILDLLPLFLIIGALVLVVGYFVSK